MTQNTNSVGQSRPWWDCYPKADTVSLDLDRLYIFSKVSFTVLKYGHQSLNKWLISCKDWCWSWNSNIWPPNASNWLIGKDPAAGKDWRQEEKGTTEDYMVGWHHDQKDMSLRKLQELVMASMSLSKLRELVMQPGVLQSLGSQRVGHNRQPALNWRVLSGYMKEFKSRKYIKHSRTVKLSERRETKPCSLILFQEFSYFTIH